MKVKEIMKNLTLEQKAGLCSGKNFWTTKDIPEAGIESMLLSDGPVGLRKQAGTADHLGINESIKAIAFPSGCLSACAFDREMMKELGETLGEECQAEEIAVLLGPSINIKRSPLCGRNFEYISEDPYLTGELSVPYIKGLQSKHVGASVKHYAANSQEKNRVTSTSNMDERTLREIYLPAFEKAVKEAQPWTVMASYNKVNNVYASENQTLLTDILRNEWGFEGFVVSDWNAVVHRVQGLSAGMDLEMPGCYGRTDRQIVEAIQSGKMDEAVLDQAVERILKVTLEYQAHKQKIELQYERDHAIATRMAEKSMVLLKNDGILPLDKESKVAFIGEFAKNPRYQGGGSANVNAFCVEGALDCARDLNVIYAQGYETQVKAMESDVAKDSNREKRKTHLIEEAVEVAKQADVAVVFIGLPDEFESEGYDREHLNIPEVQNQLVDAICDVQKNVVVVLHNGSPILMPWLHRVSAVLESYLGGEGVGQAQVRILYGDVNPSGKLAETFPLCLAHNPSYTNFAPVNQKVEYREGVYVGYRWYDTRNLDVLFPFGYGLSYTTFEYSNLQLSKKSIKDTEHLMVSVDVTNTGTRAGDEIVQLYVSDLTKETERPEKELKGFERIHLEAGETKTVTMTLDKRSFAWYSEVLQDWYAGSGTYVIKIGKSSREIVLSEEVELISSQKLPIGITEDTILSRFYDNPEAKAYIMELMEPFFKAFNIEGDKMGEVITRELPLHGLQGFVGLTDEQLEETIQKLKEICKE